MNTTKIAIKELEDKYNADNDLIPGSPEVTWTEYKLLQIIKQMEKRLDRLERPEDDVIASECRERQERIRNRQARAIEDRLADLEARR